MGDDQAAARRLSPAEFFDDSRLYTTELPIPELGGSVRIRALSALQQDQYELKLATGGMKDVSYRAYMAYYGCVNDDGSLFFARTDDAGEAVPDETVIRELSERNAWGVLDQIANAIEQISAPARDYNAVKKTLGQSRPGASGE